MPDTPNGRSYNGSMRLDDDHHKTGITGYPKGAPRYASTISGFVNKLTGEEGIRITPNLHFAHHTPTISNFEAYNNPKFDDDSYLIHARDHFIRDIHDPKLSLKPTMWINEEGVEEPRFSGSSSFVNPTFDPDKHEIADLGLDIHEKNRLKKKK